jgi:hypothetical protein
MRYMSMLIGLTALVFVATGSARGGPSPQLSTSGSSTVVTSPASTPVPAPAPTRSKSCPKKTNNNTPHGNCGKGGNSNLP